MIRLANAQIWVHDQDEALAFYTGKLGWEVRADISVPEWSFRWLVVGPVGQEAMGVVLMGYQMAPWDDQMKALIGEVTARAAAPRCSSRPRTARLPTTTSSRTASSSPRSRPCAPTGSTAGSATRRATTSA